MQIIIPMYEGGMRPATQSREPMAIAANLEMSMRILLREINPTASEPQPTAIPSIAKMWVTFASLTFKRSPNSVTTSSASVATR